MGLYSSPSPPPAPDYAAANRAGIEADASTLPFRLAVSQAARLGTSYTDPETGKTYDFTGLGEDALMEADIAAAIRMMEAGSDLAFQEEFKRYQMLAGDGETPGMLQQFNDLNLAAQRAAAEMGLEFSDRYTQNQLDQELAYRPQFAESQRNEDRLTFLQNLELSEVGTRQLVELQRELMPELSELGEEAAARAFLANLKQAAQAAEQSFGQNLEQSDRAATAATEVQQRLLPHLNELASRLQADSARAAGEAGRAENPEAYAVRDALGQQIASDLAAGGDLTPAQRERAEQEMRRSQASRGNILGEAPAFDEALAKTELSENIVNNRRSQALGFINSRDLSPTFGTVGVLNPTQVVNPTALTVTPNNQPVAPVNPIMPNFGTAGPVTPMVPNFQATTTGGPNLSPTSIGRQDPLAMFDPNAGSKSVSYAGNVWQTNVEQAANQTNPWMEGLGMVAGTALGAFTGGIGTAAAGAASKALKWG